MFILIAAFLLAPLSFLLAHFPQSPDGAEMVNVALFGGVLHPSGMPLQAWLNRAAVLVAPGEPGYVLSWMSWIGAVGTTALLGQTLRRLGAGLTEAVLAMTAYAYIPVVAMMSTVPEKYSWLSLTQMLFIYFLVRTTSLKRAELRDWMVLSLSLSLALAQHSANVILIPAYLFALSSRRPTLRVGLISGSVLLGGTALAYLSLLGLRSIQPWPDWGQLESLVDVFHHAVRTDYGYTQLFNSDLPGERISALWLLAKGMVGFHLAFALVFAGVFAMTRTTPGRYMAALLFLILLPGLGILLKTSMPAADYGSAMGYQERYPLLVWPLIMLFWGVGVAWLLTQAGQYKTWVTGVLAAAVLAGAYQGAAEQVRNDSDLAEIYRQQAAYEMNDFAIFWTSSDFTAFYGIPRKDHLVFPLKNLIGLSWYRDKVVPVLSPPVARILSAGAISGPPELFRRAIAEGFKIVITEPTPFLADEGIMRTAEQTGVLWNFSSSNSALYTKQLIANTLHLCTLLPNVKYGVPEEGLYFLREYLNSFHFAFMSAADYLQQQMELPPAQAARDVATSLVPGIEPSVWKEKCAVYAHSMQVK